jgi:hypothetical protein
VRFTRLPVERSALWLGAPVPYVPQPQHSRASYSERRLLPAPRIHVRQHRDDGSAPLRSIAPARAISNAPVACGLDATKSELAAVHGQKLRCTRNRTDQTSWSEAVKPAFPPGTVNAVVAPENSVLSLE